MRARRSSGAAGADTASVRPVRSHAGAGARAGAALAWRRSVSTGGAIGDTLILCYHGLSESWPSPSAIPAERLERQLCHLLERGYRGTTFSDAVLSRPRGKTVAVTFDDAYRSIGEQALPLLSRLGLPATLFVPTLWVGLDTPMAWEGMEHYVGGAHESELLPLSWAEIASLSDAGWEIGSHTRSHPDLTTLDDDALDGELAGSRADLEQRLGRPCPAIAYPYGLRDARVVRAADRAGYRAGAALPVRVHRPRTLDWPRVGVYANDSDARFRAKASPRLRRLIGSRIGEALLRRGPLPDRGAGSSPADPRA
jgi:peptidoglycan/xylan/chitin deacetylase (PgdA/CDA1 family)